MQFARANGVLLHPTSLPGRFGIGDLGDWAYRFVDFLVETDQSLWQMLPLGPTGYGDSPYQSLSTFAGNPLLISLERLVQAGWLTPLDLNAVPDFPRHKVDFGWVIPYRTQMLNLAFTRFTRMATPDQRAAYEAWCAQNRFWLDDFALFVALKEAHKLRPWVEWERGLALREPEAMAAAAETYAEQIVEQKFRQWVFHEQWFALKQYANAKGIRLIGDIPIFVAHDSSDVWSARELFYLDEDGQPTFIAGVPPDYFSETGQRWGNPLYRWDRMRADGFMWWIQRLRSVLSMVDIVRIDHFRGFEAYWEIPASEQTAVKGRWVPAPGQALFDTILKSLGELPIIAEDLGVITRGVEALRDGFHLPGMKVLQFAWGDLSGINVFLPHNYTPACIVYTGTHDNNTTVGWWNGGEATQQIKEHVGRYAGHYVVEINWEMIRLAMASVARMCVVPLQDLLGLGAEARMNTPGVESGNWAWRMTEDQFNWLPRERLREMTRFYARNPGAVPKSPDHSRGAGTA
jgi:4-alpha-glucanotransferase